MLSGKRVEVASLVMTVATLAVVIFFNTRQSHQTAQALRETRRSNEVALFSQMTDRMQNATGLIFSPRVVRYLRSRRTIRVGSPLELQIVRAANSLNLDAYFLKHDFHDPREARRFFAPQLVCSFRALLHVLSKSETTGAWDALRELDAKTPGLGCV